jgi:hypothetical protein
MAHINATIRANKTITGGSVAHVGQLYFDQDLINAVTKTAPYNTNKQFMVPNQYDFLLAQAAGGADPVVEYVMLGPKIEDGLFGFVNFGIDAKLNRTVREASKCSESGCVAQPKGSGGPGGPKPPGGWDMFGGAFGPPKGATKGTPKGTTKGATAPKSQPGR